MSIRLFAAAIALLALVAVAPAFAQSQPTEPQAATILDGFGNPILDGFGKPVVFAPEED